MRILVTGSSGLIGSEAVKFYCEGGHDVVGFDNNMREFFFGPKGSTRWMTELLEKKYTNFLPANVDIRNYESMKHYFGGGFDAVIHCAAQPSHDKAAEFPLIDFAVNAQGTLNLLELTRLYCKEAVFIYMSTNKVYGDAPNEEWFTELETRYTGKTFDESTRIDQSTHSVFGASKAAADLMTQEYGKYFGMNTVCFRGGCLTGPSHSGVELHGFLSYLVKAVKEEIPYTIFGYKGKQVRDNIHSCDVIAAFEEFRKNPMPGEVFNMGGGPENNISMLEAIKKIEALAGKPLKYSIVETPRVGDHICYVSNIDKFKSCYPNWKITKSIDDILEELVNG